MCLSLREAENPSNLLELARKIFTAPAACTAAQGGDSSWARDSDDDDVKSSKRICVRAEKGEVLGGECGNHYSSVAVDQQQPIDESNITKREFAL